MSAEELKYPEWQCPLQEAILEFRPQELFAKVHRAEAAIFERFQALSSSGDHHKERDALSDALSTLRVLKRDTLAFPDWNG
jgi:hypothetical protein